MYTDGRSDDRMRHLRGRLLAALLLAGTVPVHALSTDSSQPISIVADEAEHDDATRITIYRGNVIIDQGTLRILGDTVTVIFDAHDQVTKITSVGAPSRFRQLPDGADADDDYRKARASRMEYFPEQDLIMLFGEARYEEGRSRVQADRLVYDSLNARFKALTDASAASAHEEQQPAEKKPERVRIRIKPKKKSTQ